MTKLINLFFLVGLSLFGLNAVHAQDLLKDSSNVTINNVEKLFLKAIKQQSAFYNGKLYQTYGSNVEGYATFKDLGLVNGNVTYNAVQYNDVPLLYDLYIDRLVSVSYDRRSMFSFNNELVSDFHIDNHHFVFVSIKGGDIGADVKTGFFELIHDGELKILAKHVKKLQFTTNKDVPYYFSLKTSYFLKRADKYYEFVGEGSLLNLLKDKKRELKQHLTSNKIKYKENPEQAMAIIASYYESLIK